MRLALNKNLIWMLILLCGLILLIPACSASPDEIDQTPTSQPDGNLPPEVPQPQPTEIRQWAIEAEASSSFADPEWAPEQAAGKPNTLRCGDLQTAWAAAVPDTLEWLELKYSTDVYVTAVNITQTFNPNQISKVELIDSFGNSLIIYEQPPVPVDQPCPYTLSIPVEKTRSRYNTVRVTVDQSALGLGWNEIDAVELVGERK
ncbi:MAG: hypothetical protein U9Q82_15935, partial [Chloroflexota bacterium]|nr:hypothetical protein [Chloroflexota bacterium]